VRREDGRARLVARVRRRDHEAGDVAGAELVELRPGGAQPRALAGQRPGGAVLDGHHLRRQPARRDHAHQAVAGLRERRDDGIVRAVEQHLAVAHDRHPAILVDGRGTGQTSLRGGPVEQVAVGGAGELVVELRLELREAAVRRQPVQAREIVVVVREPLAGPAQQRAVRLVGDRRDVAGRLGQPARLAARDRHEVDAVADAAVGVVVEVGEERDGGAVRGHPRRPGRPRAGRQPARAAAVATDDVQVVRAQHQADAVVPPLEPPDHAGGRLAVGALADQRVGPLVLGDHDEPAPVGVPVELGDPARQRRDLGRLAPVDRDHVQLRAGVAAVGQERERRAVGREPRGAVLTVARGQPAGPAARVRHEPDRAAVDVPAGRATRVGDELPVRGKGHLTERDLPAQVGRCLHAMTSTCGAAP
jgi:hypothetical protein